MSICDICCQGLGAEYLATRDEADRPVQVCLDCVERAGGEDAFA